MCDGSQANTNFQNDEIFPLKSHWEFESMRIKNL
jgi:hypothetical protein